MKRFRAVLFLISFVMLALIIWNSNPAMLVTLLGKSSKFYLVAGLLVSLATISLRVLKWKVLLTNVSFPDLYPIQMIGITISNFTPGKIAEPVKSVILKSVKKISVSSSLPTILWERVLDIVVLVGFSAFMVNFISAGSGVAYIASASIIVFLAVALATLTVLKSRKFGTMIFSVAKKLPFLGGISEKFIDTFYDFRIAGGKIVSSFFVTSIVWFLEGFVLYFSFLSLGIEMDPLFSSGLIAVSVLVGVASSLPGGLGSFETVMIFIITGRGIEGSLATAGVLLYRFLSFGLSSIIGGISFVYLSGKFDLSVLSKQVIHP